MSEGPLFKVTCPFTSVFIQTESLSRLSAGMINSTKCLFCDVHSSLPCRLKHSCVWSVSRSEFKQVQVPKMLLLNHMHKTWVQTSSRIQHCKINKNVMDSSIQCLISLNFTILVPHTIPPPVVCVWLSYNLQKFVNKLCLHVRIQISVGNDSLSCLFLPRE